MRLILTFVVVLVINTSLFAQKFQGCCFGGPTISQSDYLHEASFVIHGILNEVVHKHGPGDQEHIFTTVSIEGVIKNHPVLELVKKVKIEGNIGAAKSKTILYVNIVNGTPKVLYHEEYSSSFVKYLKGLCQIDAKDEVARTAHVLGYLCHENQIIQNDPFTVY
jgi:hypothetical protein